MGTLVFFGIIDQSITETQRDVSITQPLQRVKETYPSQNRHLPSQATIAESPSQRLKETSYVQDNRRCLGKHISTG